MSNNSFVYTSVALAFAAYFVTKALSTNGACGTYDEITVGKYSYMCHVSYKNSNEYDCYNGDTYLTIKNPANVIKRNSCED